MSTSVPPITIRSGAPGDAHALSRFAARVFEATYAHANTPENMRAYLAQHFGEAQQAAELADPSLETLLVERSGEREGDGERKLVGFAQLRGGPAPSSVSAAMPVEIARIYVDHALHGMGVGASLMRACIDAARARGSDALWLGVWEHNARAIAFYQRQGFRIVGTLVFALGDDQQTDHVMLLELSKRASGA